VFGLETVAINKRQEAELKKVEMQMLRFCMGVTKKCLVRGLEEDSRGDVWML
jgi:hypothetical protein